MHIKHHNDIQEASKEEKKKVFKVADKLIADNKLSKGTKVFNQKQHTDNRRLLLADYESH